VQDGQERVKFQLHMAVVQFQTLDQNIDYLLIFAKLTVCDSDVVVESYVVELLGKIVLIL
jgi:hypothetical protein